MRKFLVAAAMAGLMQLAHAAAQVAQVVDWDPTGQGGTLGSTTVQVITQAWFGVPSSQPEYWSGAAVAATFGAPYFAGPVSLDEGLLITVPAQLGSSYAFEFSQPVQDVRLSLGSFASRASISNELGHQFVRESGQVTFFVFCDVATPCIYGQASNAGTPNDSNGTVLIPGLSTRVNVFVTSVLTVPDQVSLQLSAIPLASPVPEPAGWALLLAGGAVMARRLASRTSRAQDQGRRQARPVKHLLSISIALAGSIAGAQQALDAKAAAAWYSGVTVEGQTSDGNSVRVYHSPSGVAKGLIAGQHANDGPWKVRDDGAVCIDWRDKAWGRNPCYWIKEDTDGYWKLERTDDAKTFIRVLRIEGNKYGM